MSQWIEDDKICNGTKLHYYRTGSGNRSLVLLHGITDDGLCWESFAKSLEDSFDIVMPDLRGHGKSEAPDKGYTLETMAAETAALLTGLGLKQSIILGASLGGILALALAGFYPDLVQAIILEDAPPFWDWETDPMLQEEFRGHMHTWITGLKRKTHDDLLSDARGNNHKWPAAELQHWADSKHRFDLKITRLLIPADILPPAFHALLGRIACPALFIRADRKTGAICEPEKIAKLQALVPQLEVAHIAGAGHNIRRDQPVRYAKVFMDFINR